jgi:hypothetical protein
LKIKLKYAVEMEMKVGWIELAKDGMQWKL